MAFTNQLRKKLATGKGNSHIPEGNLGLLIKVKPFELATSAVGTAILASYPTAYFPFKLLKLILKIPCMI